MFLSARFSRIRKGRECGCIFCATWYNDLEEGLFLFVPRPLGGRHLTGKGDGPVSVERAGAACVSDNPGNSAKAEFNGDASPGHYIHYRLFGLAIVSAFVAVAIWPFDETLSNMLSISRVGHVATPLWWEALKGVRVFGKAEILFVLGFLLAIHRRKQTAVCACIAVLLAGLIVTPAKLIVGRPRPDRSSNTSFPSGDVASLTAFVVPIAATFPAVRSVAFACVVTVGAVRVANGFHFPSDIFAGIAIGIFSAAIVLSTGFSLKPRIRRLLRRSWLAAALGAVIILHLFLPSIGNFRTFFSIFGPLAVLLALSPFIRAWLRSRRKMDKRLLSVTICSLGALLLAVISWFVLRLVPALKVRLPAFLPADPAPVWAIISMGGTLAAMILLGVREYGAERYRSALGVLMVGMAGLFFIVFTFAWAC
jgi:membrane-associated phospholipid phosphatase